jgi:hypothetical protein
MVNNRDSKGAAAGTVARKRRVRFGRAALVLAGIAAALLPLSACATDSPRAPSEASGSTVAYETGVPGGLMVKTVEMSARVTGIDEFNREVTLVGSDGQEFTVAVGSDAVDLDRIQVGDMVEVAVAEQLVVHLDEGEAASVAGSAAVAALGAQSGGMAAYVQETVGTVTVIDRERRTVTLRFEDGSTETFPVRPDIDLSKHDVGERVIFRMTDMVAIRIEKQ